MALDPEAKMVLDFMAQAGLPELSTLSVEAARIVSSSGSLPPGPDAVIEDRSIPGPGGALGIRIYRSREAPEAPEAPDATRRIGGLVYFHGGGFVLGTLDRHDALCSELAVGTPCVVISVDYRLAPEHKFPAAIDDAYFATRWVHEHAAELGVDDSRIAVGGDSAGGNLAAVVARLAIEQGSPALAFQLLLYPVTDLRSFDTPSYQENATGMYLTRNSMRWFAGHYLRSADDGADPRASPLAATNLTGLPPALIITAEHDPLRDEGAAYADSLRAAQVPVEMTCYPGMIHAFISLYAYMGQGRVALQQCVKALQRMQSPRSLV